MESRSRKGSAIRLIEFFESGWLAVGTNSDLGRADGRKAAGSHQYILKGLILAQNERWRRGLGMQVERVYLVAILGKSSGVRGSNTWERTLRSGIAARNGE